MDRFAWQAPVIGSLLQTFDPRGADYSLTNNRRRIPRAKAHRTSISKLFNQPACFWRAAEQSRNKDQRTDKTYFATSAILSNGPAPQLFVDLSGALINRSHMNRASYHRRAVISRTERRTLLTRLRQRLSIPINLPQHRRLDNRHMPSLLHDRSLQAPPCEEQIDATFSHPSSRRLLMSH